MEDSLKEFQGKLFIINDKIQCLNLRIIISTYIKISLIWVGF